MPSTSRGPSRAASPTLDALAALDANLRVAITRFAHQIARTVVADTLTNGSTQRPRARPVTRAAERVARAGGADAALGAAVVSSLLATPRQSPSALARALGKPAETV